MDTTLETERPARRRRTARRQSGSIFRRGDDSWTLVFRNPDGKQKWLGGFETKGIAQKRLTEELEKIGNGTYHEVQAVLFKEFCETCLSLWKSMLKPSTWCTWKSAINKWLVPQFGVLRVDQFSSGGE